MYIGLYVILWAAWIGLLFYPRFSKRQLWKTIISASHPVFLYLSLITGFGFFTATGKEGEFLHLLIDIFLWIYILCKAAAFIWNVVDVITVFHLPKERRGNEFCRRIIQLILFVVTFVYLKI